jgi:GxxExxY protein
VINTETQRHGEKKEDKNKERRKGAMLIYEELTKEICGAAIEVHRELGPGLLESSYETALCYELGLRNIAFRSQVPLPVVYKGVQLDAGYRIDLVVEEKVVVELKTLSQSSLSTKPNC